MQHTQYNFLKALLVTALLGSASPALAGSIDSRSGPDPLLDGGKPGPCAALAAGVDYAPGTDAMGNPVVPADVAAAKVPMPDEIAIPLSKTQQGAGNPNTLGSQSPYVSLDGKKLAPLVNPPACNAPGH